MNVQRPLTALLLGMMLTVIECAAVARTLTTMRTATTPAGKIGESAPDSYSTTATDPDKAGNPVSVANVASGLPVAAYHLNRDNRK